MIFLLIQEIRSGRLLFHDLYFKKHAISQNRGTCVCGNFDAHSFLCGGTVIESGESHNCIINRVGKPEHVPFLHLFRDELG